MSAKIHPMGRSQRAVDFAVRDEGTLWVFSPQTPAAHAFAKGGLGLASWQWLGDVFCIEHRIAPDLVERLRAEGWRVVGE